VVESPRPSAFETFTGARSFALKGSLLPNASLETLAESSSLDELVNRLKGTPYAEAVSKLQPPYSAHRLELALRERLADVHYSLMKTAKDPDLLEVYYLRNIAWNLKIALKAKALGRGYDETMTYIDLHSEELAGRRDLIARVLSSKDLQEATALLEGTEFGKDVAKAATAFATSREPRVFDLYVDHALFSRIAETFAAKEKSSTGEIATVRDLVAIDVDSYNVLALLRSKLWGVQASESRGLLILPPFNVSLPRLQRIVNTESVAESLGALEGTYRIGWPSGGGDDVVVSALEEGFVQLSKKTARRAFLWQGFTLSTVLALVKLVEFEVQNLAAIAFGVEAGVPTKQILSSLRL
jgi:V/A-type H+/Na+-transporting ATPase subunit C